MKNLASFLLFAIISGILGSVLNSSCKVSTKETTTEETTKVVSVPAPAGFDSLSFIEGQLKTGILEANLAKSKDYEYESSITCHVYGYRVNGNNHLFLIERLTEASSGSYGYVKTEKFGLINGEIVYYYSERKNWEEGLFEDILWSPYKPILKISRVEKEKDGITLNLKTALSQSDKEMLKNLPNELAGYGTVALDILNQVEQHNIEIAQKANVSPQGEISIPGVYLSEEGKKLFPAIWKTALENASMYSMYNGTYLCYALLFGSFLESGRLFVFSKIIYTSDFQLYKLFNFQLLSRFSGGYDLIDFDTDL